MKPVRTTGKIARGLTALYKVRFGSLADIAARSRHVRFSPQSGHSSSALATSALCQKETLRPFFF